jgi:multidrug resistance protein
MFSPRLLIFVTVFLDIIGFGIVLPLLPGYAASFHVGATTIGMLVASFSLMQFLFAPWWGNLSDRVGRRPVLLIGLAGSTLSYLLFAVADSFWLLLLSRVIAGGMGATVNVAQAYLADTTAPENRGHAMGLIGAAFGLGFVVGPAIGGIAAHWSLHAPGLVASGLTGANLLLALVWLPESRVGRTAPRGDGALHWSRFTAAFAAVGLSTLAFTVLYVVFPLEVEHSLGLHRGKAAYLFVLIGLVGAIVQGGLVGRLVPRVGERVLMGTGGLLLAVGLGMLPMAFGAGHQGGLAELYVALTILASGSALISPSAAAYVSRVASREEQGRALGLLQSVAAVARIVGPVLAGVVAGVAGARGAFLVASGAAGLAGLSVAWSRHTVPAS